MIEETPQPPVVIRPLQIQHFNLPVIMIVIYTRRWRMVVIVVIVMVTT
jgi:hypothetical protein